MHAGLPLLGLKGAMVAGSLVDAGLGLLLLYAFAAGRRALPVYQRAIYGALQGG